MKHRILYLVLMLSTCNALAADSGEQVTQKSLDGWCESAKQTEQQELKRRIIDICKQKGRSDAQCKQEGADYGSMQIHSFDPSADLPVCVQAREFRKAHGAQK